MDDLKSRYQLDTRLAEGPAGETWSGRGRRTGRRVIVEFGDAAAPALAGLRAVMARRLPGLQVILEVGTEAGRGFVVLEPAARVTRAGERPARAVDFAHRLAAGLAALHAAGLARGGIAPEHVEWTATGEPRLTLAGLLAAPSAVGPEATARDVETLLALLQQWTGGEGAVRALSEHPEGRPYRTAQELAETLDEPRVTRGSPARALLLAGVAALGAVALFATRSHEPIVERVVGRAGPAEAPAALPPPLEIGRRPGPRGGGAGSGAGEWAGGPRRDPGQKRPARAGAARPEHRREPASAASAAASPVGTWRCTVRERAQEAPLLTILSGGSFRIESDLGRGRRRLCDGAWKAEGRDRFRLSGACTVMDRKGPNPARPYKTSLRMKGTSALSMGGGKKPARGECARVG
ncbi:MAG: hypothetical protein KJ067_17840 [Vicinamibacteria bacterium]|nr:hypothetical protein [Vicinamibacteria bacterium]